MLRLRLSDRGPSNTYGPEDVTAVTALRSGAFSRFRSAYRARHLAVVNTAADCGQITGEHRGLFINCESVASLVASLVHKNVRLSPAAGGRKLRHFVRCTATSRRIPRRAVGRGALCIGVPTNGTKSQEGPHRGDGRRRRVPRLSRRRYVPASQLPTGWVAATGCVSAVGVESRAYEGEIGRAHV